LSDPVLAFTGGGTWGHVFPGLAVIERLRARGFRGRIVWLGSRKESDRAAVEAAGVEYLAIPSGKLRREASLENLLDAFRVAAGWLSSLRALRALRPALLFSKGGYVSVPPCAAAAALGLPCWTHESDLSPGLATRLNARWAERVLLAWEATRASLSAASRPRAVVVGNPVRRAVREGDAARGRAFLGAPAGLPIVLFLGGSQGARQVNELALAVLPGLAGRAFVVHQTGESAGGSDAASAAAACAEGYRAFAYIRAEMADIMAAADIVVGRAGAGMLWECSALGKAMVLVPLSGQGTRGDQVENARFFSAAGAARVLDGSNATPERLAAELDSLLDDAEARRSLGEAARSLAGQDAAEATASLILERLGGNA
jgi:UDP-N-acetylglucosamine--N-acetylmuramyl-(pentapeptide) pyrophosphoryl-undecaprenol N-acetylglucosamine transferase